jgi:hypothetical protein
MTRVGALAIPVVDPCVNDQLARRVVAKEQPVLFDSSCDVRIAVTPEALQLQHDLAFAIAREPFAGRF